MSIALDRKNSRLLLALSELLLRPVLLLGLALASLQSGRTPTSGASRGLRSGQGRRDVGSGRRERIRRRGSVADAVVVGVYLLCEVARGRRPEQAHRLAPRDHGDAEDVPSLH